MQHMHITVAADYKQRSDQQRQNYCVTMTTLCI